MFSLPSSSSSSSCVSPKKYDVFLSFRGEDTRKNFTDHLYAALTSKAIFTFRDDERLEAGEAIASELFKAIQESWCSIIVFSKTYAFSGWCLDELAEIVKQKKEGWHKIFPIFYHVDPSDLRKQTGRVAEAFAKHEERYKENKDKTQSWRSALTEVANVKGWDLKDRPESEFIEEIVKTILAILPQTYSGVSDGLIGINSRSEELLSKININVEDDVRVIGICGMGGIGKTTLARVVCNQMSRHFEDKIFLSDVRDQVLSDKSGVSIQKQLLSQIFPKECFNFFNVYEGSFMISRRLSHKKVLMVIDDVDNIEHLEWLVGRRDWFGLGSRVIVTTRDEHVLISYGVNDVYKPTALDDNDALRLFRLKAFKGYTPENDFIELSKRVVKYADGLPLALEVLGSFFCGRTAAQWESAIERLTRDSNKKIHDRLRISYDGLEEETEKKIFLDVACFFKGQEKDFVTKILDGCEFSPEIGIDVLVKKSLIKVDHYNYLRMHDLLQEMGRKIVKQKSPEEPGKRCRLWEEGDVCRVLTNNTATEAIEVMDINIISKCWEQRMLFTSINVDAFSKMTKLRLLRVSNLPHPRDDLNYLSNELRLLDWTEYPFRSLPSSFQPYNLVALLLTYSRIEQLWQGQVWLEKLKLVDLTGSGNLIKTPDFTMAPNLESLILKGCIKILDIHPSIGLLRRLKLLNLSNCKSLRSLPTKIGMKSLETLILSGCSNLERLPNQIDGEMECLVELYLDGMGIRDLPCRIGHLRGLVSLYLNNCRNLASIPSSIYGLKCLKSLNLSRCSKLENLPGILQPVESLERFYLDGTGIRDLPFQIGHMKGLVSLSLKDCRNLASIPSSIYGLKCLKTLNLSGCFKVENLPEILQPVESLERLYLKGTGIQDLPYQIGHMRGLVSLSLKYCRNLASIPSSIYGLKFLRTLNLSRCSKVENLPEILQPVESLEWLYLDKTGIRDLPSQIGHMKGLVSLSLKDCRNLVSLPSSIYGLKCLKSLDLSGCSKLENLPEILQPVESLERFYLDGTDIRDLPSQIGHMKGLVSVSLKNCRNLASIPSSLYGLKVLRSLDLSGCSKLENLPEILQPVESLEELYLDGTGIRDLPSQIGHIRGLVSLYLDDWRNLASLPSSKYGLKCLKTLDLSGCSELENLPEILQPVESLEELDLNETAITKPPSFTFEFKVKRGGSMNSMALALRPLSGLTSLTRLDISYRNLGEGDIPSDICSLSSLERLHLGGNKIISLPANLDRLSNLRYLGLDDCTELKSLPASLATTCTLELRDRGGLFANAAVSGPMNSGWASISLINCHGLGENTNLLTLLKKHLKAYANVTSELDIMLPGSEIPEWFSHRRGGYSIKIRLPPDILNDSQFIGAAFCYVLGNVDSFSCTISVCYHGRMSGIYQLPRTFLDSRPFTKHHLWLCFCSRDKLQYCVDFYDDLTECLSSLEFEYTSDELGIEAMSSYEVVKCGIRLVYERDLEEMENIECHLLQICNPNSATFEF